MPTKLSRLELNAIETTVHHDNRALHHHSIGWLAVAVRRKQPGKSGLNGLICALRADFRGWR